MCMFTHTLAHIYMQTHIDIYLFTQDFENNTTNLFSWKLAKIVSHRWWLFGKILHLRWQIGLFNDSMLRAILNKS